jgi:carbamoyl-phosphate synthase small subunit
VLPQLFPEGINRFPPAILALADGTIFRGVSIGAPGHTVAEVVFNTAMTGYQEILTDPSYSGQIVTLTYPHIGNTGVNAEDVEANRVYAAGLVVRDCPARVSNFRSTQSLPEYLSEQGIVAISGIDTRKLTRILREKGAQGACIFVGADAERAVELAQGFAGMAGQDLARVVSVKASAEWTEGTWQLGEGFSKPDQSKFHVVAYDFGTKTNILRLLADRGQPAGQHARDARFAVRRHAAGLRAHRPSGLLLPGPPRSQPRSARHPGAVRQVHQPDVRPKVKIASCPSVQT